MPAGTPTSRFACSAPGAPCSSRRAQGVCRLLCCVQSLQLPPLRSDKHAPPSHQDLGDPGAPEVVNPHLDALEAIARRKHEASAAISEKPLVKQTEVGRLPHGKTMRGCSGVA